MAGARNTAKLSNNVLQMKFMQRSVLRIEREQNEEERQKIIDDEHWVLDLPQYQTKECRFLKDQSYVTCEELTFGRQSFRGFNPEIEKLMQSQINEKEAKQSEEREKKNSVSDQDMAHRYSTLMDVISRKFTKKRSRGEAEDEDSQRPSRKKTFIKPDID